MRFDVSDFSLQEADSDRYKNSYKVMNIARLSKAIDSLEVAIVNDKNFVLKTMKTDFYADRQSVKSSNHKDFYNDYDTLSAGKKLNVDEYALNKISNLKLRYQNVQDNFKDDTEYLNRHKIEYHRKFALSLACVILFFIGAPLGAIIKKGGLGMPIVVSVISFIIYYVLGEMGNMLARSGTIAPWFGMWISSIVFLPIGIFLTIKATSDAKILSAEEWKRKLNLLFNKNKNSNAK